MRMKAELHAEQTVSPQMIASVEVLQYGSQELAEYLEELSYENPMMEIEEADQKEAAPSDTAFADKLRWLKNSDRQNRSYYTDEEGSGSDQYLRAQQTVYLSDYLQEQIQSMEVPAEVRRAMETVVNLLDDRGLFSGSVGEIAELADCSADAAGSALKLVREMEPAGVAAESVQAALCRQAERLNRPAAERLLAEQFQHLGTWSDRRLARAAGVSEETVAAAKTLITSLNPYPANGFAGHTENWYVTPDVSIVADRGMFTAVVEERYLPRVRINSDYLSLLNRTEDPQVKAYLTGKLRQLEQVMGNLDRRKSTLQKCSEIIAERQAAFLRGGILHTLTLRDVGEELGLHESTISRAVKNKYVQCDRGLLPMAVFFSRDAGQNTGFSRSGIQEMMRKIIEDENPAHPMSDDKIARALGKQHILLSRRAVAKYRTELGIPPASGRKNMICSSEDHGERNRHD